MNGTKLFYWDACIFLAWLKNENRPDDEMDALNSVVRDVQSKKINILTSALTYTEVLDVRLPDGAFDQFSHFMINNREVTVASVDQRIATLAGELRKHYLDRPDEYNKTLSTPDAIHLATAIHYKADEFHTFDKRGNKSLGLLDIGENVGSHQLTICKPRSV